MRNTIAIIASLIALYCSAYALDEDHVRLRVNIEPDHPASLTPRPSRMGEINVHINGNHWGYVVDNRSGSINKYLFDGTNTLSISGHAIGRVRINLVSTPNYGKRPSGSILSKELSVQENGEIKSVYNFVVKRISGQSYALDDISSIDRSKAKNELRAITSNIYSYYNNGKKHQFVNTILAGSRLHSPHAYKFERLFITQIFDDLNLAPFPEQLHFIFGTNLVTVYSRKNSSGNLLLFSFKKHEFGGINGLTFGRINGEWIVW